jgi:hypothetical protein
LSIRKAIFYLDNKKRFLTLAMPQLVRGFLTLAMRKAIFNLGNKEGDFWPWQ